MRKTARFVDFNIRGRRVTTNCKLYKRCACHELFCSM